MTSPFDAVLADRNAAARAWKAKGGKVVGYLGVTVPVELIEAAGAFPLQLAGHAAMTPLADRYMESLFDPIVRAVFEGLLAGDYDFLDAVVLSRTSDSIQRLYYYLCEVRRMGEAPIPEPILYDLLHTPWYSSAEYDFARTRELKATLERVTGQAADGEALATAIAAGNYRRGLLNAIVARRRSRPATLSGVAAHQAMAASRVLDLVTFAAVAPPPVQPNPGLRVVIAGSPLDSPRLHALLETEGAVVVGDFHEFGEPAIGPMIDEAAPPLRAITEHYHRGVISSRTFPQSTQPLLDLAQAVHADAVVFYFYAEEEALTWDYPAQRRALVEAGIAVLCLDGRPHHPDASDAAQVGRFLAGLKAPA